MFYNKYLITREGTLVTIPNNELYHYGVKGMKWGVRRQEKMREKAEKKLGRPLKFDDFGGDKITNRGIRKVKKYDELETAYKKVRKKGDPCFDWVHGLNLQTQTVLSDRKIKRIINKMQKDSSTDVKQLVDNAHRIQKGEKIAGRLLASVGKQLLVAVPTTVVLYEANRRYNLG